MLRFIISAVVLMCPGFILYAMHNKGNANRGGAPAGEASFRLANDLIEVVTARVRLLGHKVAGHHAVSAFKTKWKFFHDFANDRIPLYMVRYWWSVGPCFYGECWVRFLYDTIKGVSKSESWATSRKLIRRRKYTMGNTLNTLYHNGGTILLEVYGDLLNVFKVPQDERAIMIKVQKLYLPHTCEATVQFLCGIYLKTHGVDISVPDMQTKLCSDLRVYRNSKGFLIKSDTNHANGIRITIMP